MRWLFAFACVVAISVAPAATAKGRGPTAIAVGYGRVWIGFGDGTMRSVDPATHRLGHAIRTSWGPSVKDIAVGYGSVWVAAGLVNLVRLEPRTGRVHEIFRLGRGWTASQVEVGADGVWVGDTERNLVFRYDPRRSHVARTIPVPGRLLQIAATPSGLWALVFPGRGVLTGPAGPRLLVRLYPRRAIPIRVRCDQSLAVGLGAVWMTNQCDGTLTRVDAETNRVTRMRFPGMHGVALGFGSVWLIGESTTRIDADARSVLAEVPARGYAGAAGLGRLWILDPYRSGTGTLVAVDPTANRIVGKPIKIPFPSE